MNHKAANETTIKNASPPTAENIADNPKKVIDFGNVIDYLPQGVRIIDTNCIVKYINPAFEKLSLAKAADAVGKKCYDVYPSPFCRTPQCRLVKILNGEEPSSRDRKNRPRGSIIPAWLMPSLYDENSNSLVLWNLSEISRKGRLLKTRSKKQKTVIRQ